MATNLKHFWWLLLLTFTISVWSKPQAEELTGVLPFGTLDDPAVTFDPSSFRPTLQKPTEGVSCESYSTSTQTHTRPRGSVAPAEKRWYGVADSDEDTDKDQEGSVCAWPVKCPAPNPIQPVRYCFKDKRSADNLQPILNEAIARWAPAMQDHVSALSIDLEDGCDNDPHVYCSDDRVSGDALVISDETKDDDAEFNWEECDTQSTLGYDYDSNERGRHTMEFCHLKPDSPDGTHHWAVRAMMHELGHVIGLAHEHQRPDRDDFLYYYPVNLAGYDGALEAANIDEQAIFEDDDTMKFKKKAITKDADFAKYYFPQAIPWIKSDGQIGDKWKYFTHSGPFDYNSIMIYNSNSNTDADDKYVITRKNVAEGDPIEVWMGGNKDPEKAQISAGDVARVAQLYPSGTDQGKDAQKLDVWGPHQQMLVRIRDAFETVIYAPNATKAL